jgi:hypothetical protein
MIKKLIRWIWGCSGPCQWDIISDGTLYDGEKTDGKLPIGRRYILRCKTCGELKRAQFK